MRSGLYRDSSCLIRGGCNQPTYTSQKADLAEAAKAAGNESVVSVKENKGLRDALNKISFSSSIIIAETEPGNEQVPVIPYDPLEIKSRFMEEIKNERKSNEE